MSELDEDRVPAGTESLGAAADTPSSTAATEVMPLPPAPDGARDDSAADVTVVMSELSSAPADRPAVHSSQPVSAASARADAPAFSAPAASAPSDAGAARPSDASTHAGGVASLAENRPELVIAAAFVTGFLIATILKRLAR